MLKATDFFSLTKKVEVLTYKNFHSFRRAADGNRTRDLRTTNATLYRLSHSSICNFHCKSARRDSNPRPRPWQGRTPPTEPLAHYLSTYPQNHTLKIYSSVFTTYNHGVTHRPSVYFVTLASPMSESCQVPAYRCKHLPSVPFHSSAAP